MTNQIRENLFDVEKTTVGDAFKKHLIDGGPGRGAKEPNTANSYLGYVNPEAKRVIGGLDLGYLNCRDLKEEYIQKLKIYFLQRVNDGSAGNKKAAFEAFLYFLSSIRKQDEIYEEKSTVYIEENVATAKKGDKELASRSGLLYVIGNECIVNPKTQKPFYKIDITQENDYELDLTIPGKFETYFAFEFDDCQKAEKVICDTFKDCNVCGKWYDIDVKELIPIAEICEKMGGKVLTEEVKEEIKLETEEIVSLETENVSVKPINPKYPCKVLLFPVYRALAGGKNVYNATRYCWRIAEKHRDVSEYKFAVGLKSGVSEGGYEIKEWKYVPQSNRYEFEKEREASNLQGFSWYKQINTNKGYWGFGNHFIVEFDGKGKFRLIRPDSEDQWFDC